MRPRLFECVELKSPADTLPIHSVQSAPRAASAIHLSIMVLLAGLIVLPQLAFAGYAIASPHLRNIIAEHPIMALQLVVALVLWIALFALPLSTLAGRLTWRRDIEITSESVAVADSGAFGASAWSAPLTSYNGVAHHIRSSLSGSRHELILVHPEPGRSVLLMVADHISEPDVLRMAQLLHMPQVPASVLYRARNNRQTITSKTSETADWSAAPA